MGSINQPQPTLSLERQFQIKQFDFAIENATRYELVELLKELFRQNLAQKSLYEQLLREKL